MHTLSRNEEQLASLLKLFGGIYIGALAVFLFAQQPMFAFLNQLGAVFSPAAPLYVPAAGGFWLVLTTSLMVTLVYLSFTASTDVRRQRSLIGAILISKFTSTLTYTIFYITADYTFAYLAGAIVDGSIFLLHLICYQRAFR